jgi:hypothetical protein
MKDYYENFKSEKEYDFLIGHCQDESYPIGEFINTSKINRKFTVLGHIHNQVNDHYIGSIIPVPDFSLP